MQNRAWFKKNPKWVTLRKQEQSRSKAELNEYFEGWIGCLGCLLKQSKAEHL